MTKQILSHDERSKYSLSTFIKSMLPGSPIRATLEEDVAKRLSGPDASVRGLNLVPWDVVTPSIGHRDLNVTTFGQGGALVPTDVDENVIELLRNRPLCQKLGATMLKNLSGNLALPRQTAASTVQSLPEQGNAIPSTPAIDQVVLTPHRVTCSVQFSRQLLFQSSPDVEKLIRNDVEKQVNLKIDQLAINGSGAGDEPTGILNTAGVGSVLFGGTPTWAEIVSFEAALASQNVVNDDGTQAWIASPLTKARWKTIAKTGIGVTSVVPIFLLNDNPDDRGLFNCNGYPGGATNQVPGNLVIHGKFSEMVIGIWGDGLDFILDPFSGATAATIRLTLHMWFDIALRHPQAWVVSCDAGNQ